MGDLKIEYLQISDLIPYEKNPRKNDEAVQELREIVKNG